jgi:DIS3-like exonuclease 2
VHIADVTYFLKPGTELYGYASRRATSTYLVNKCYPMLPRLLCENLCSLAENEDRLAFSVIWRFDSDGNVVEEWFGRTVIRSCVKLAYEHAQAVIEAPDLDWATAKHPPIRNGMSVDAVKGCVLGLYTLSKTLRERRYASGAIRLDKTKVAFKLNRDTGLPTECFNYTTRDSNKLVEEFMLFANMAVAKKIYDSFPEVAMLRRHEPPLDTKLEEVVEVCRRMGYEFDGESSGALHRSLQRLGETMDEVQFRTVQLLCMGPMQVAQYVCTGALESVAEARHYALAVPFYTHFTSPIRRMADVVVHYMLDAAITGEKPWHEMAEVKRQARVCNDRKAAAKKAQEDSEYLFMCLYIDANSPVVDEASICRVQDRSLDVLTLRLGVETRLRLDDMAALEM